MGVGPSIEQVEVDIASVVAETEGGEDSTHDGDAGVDWDDVMPNRPNRSVHSARVDDFAKNGMDGIVEEALPEHERELIGSVLDDFDSEDDIEDGSAGGSGEDDDDVGGTGDDAPVDGPDVHGVASVYTRTAADVVASSPEYEMSHWW